jgi:hypothetical protein
MRGIKNHYFLIFLLIIIFFCNKANGEMYNIAVSGGWSRNIDETDLQVGGAGSDLKHIYESATNAVYINIDTPDDLDNWRVDVRRVDTNWHPDLDISVKVFGNGSGTGIMSGGASYLKVDTIDQSFFSGSGDKNSIEIQLELSGVSIQIPPDSYSTTIYYTVVDTN